MPKLKTKKAALKRFRLTATGKLVRRHSGARHLLTHKARNRKRRLTSKAAISGADRRRVKKMLLI